MVYPDTGTYIASGYNQEVPIDRPILYGLFVRHVSLSHSLWFVIIIQSLIVLFTVNLVIEKFIKKYNWIISLATVLFLSFTTSLSNYSSQIMPDIYTSIIIIGIPTLLLSSKFRKQEYILALIIIFSSMTHLSNLAILLGLLIIALLVTCFKIINRNSFYKVFFIAIAPFILLPTLNKIFSDRFEISQASNIFFFARLLETNTVHDFLKKNCNEDNYIFCDKINELSNNSMEFIWAENKSPLYDNKCMELGWKDCWKEKNEAIGSLTKNILNDKSSRGIIIETFLRDFFRQMTDFSIGELMPNRSGSPTHNWIKFKFKNELEQFENSEQYKKTLYFQTISQVQMIVIIISLLILLTFLVVKKNIYNKNIMIFLFFITLGIIGNALTVTIFSTVINRYQSRVIWIIPFIAIILIANHFQSDKTTNKTHTT